MAESSAIVTPERRLTCCVLVRDWVWSTARVTPPATSAVTSRPAATSTIGLTLRGSASLAAPLDLRYGRSAAVGRVPRVPGHDELAIRLEPDRSVQADRGLVVGPGPDVAEGHVTLFEELHRLPDEHLADAPPPVLGCDVHLGYLAFKPRAGVVQDDPAEADHMPDLVPDGVDDVLAAKRRWDFRQVALDLYAAQLRVVRVVHLLAQMQLDEQGLDEEVIPGRETFHVQCPHRLRC